MKLSPYQCSGLKLALGQPDFSMTKYEDQNFTSPDIKESVLFFNPVSEHDDTINFRTYHQSIFSIKSAIAKNEKKRGR